LGLQGQQKKAKQKRKKKALAARKRAMKRMRIYEE
jgi:hypothetical protein